MTNILPGRLASRFARLATGTKLLLILAAALLPLGLIAILASVTSAQQKNADRREETLQRLELKAQRLNTAFSRSVLTISTASDAVSLSANTSRVCETTLARLEQGPVPARYGLFGDAGELRCGSAGFTPPKAPVHPGQGGTIARISDDIERLDLFVFGAGGRLEGVAEFDRETLHDLTYIPGTSRDFNLDLSEGGRTMVLRREFKPGRWRQQVAGSEEVAGGQLRLTILLSAVPFTFADVLAILLPVLMSITAAAIGWLVADRLLLRPLVRMQRAVAAYRPGDRALDLPPLTTPAREIGELGEAFRQVIQTVARHEAELEAAVERQTRLVREVHHRVKNNLQVVASLLNIHSRGSKNEDVAAAYASIQRRVDALAVVHRNHYAELEENRGVALKPLVSELAANLRATAPASAAGMTIRLDVDPYYVTQDVAVSVAFLLTEIVEFAMFCGAATVSIAVDEGDAPAPDSASLIVESESLGAGAECDTMLTERFQRIVTGLSRQLRSDIDRDEEAGRYAMRIAVVDKAER
ncbi:MAG TPA: histidine kinase dimerization/phosphoacceptor domain -containing protein [Allosphingosinicella sp.]|nr:histidine kinase dimerization/phosphoacceptor domain -containing protein [Allosphingosinicella sp.]